MNISDLSAPRELTRRERYAACLCSTFKRVLHSMFALRREEKEKKDAKERYWKVCRLCCPVSLWAT